MLFEALHQLNPVTHISSAIQHVGGFGKGKKTVNQEKYDELVHYYKYASTAYSLITFPSPNGATVLCKLFDLLTDTNGYICRDDKRREIVLVMRGTMSITNLIVDFSAKMVPLKAPSAPEPVRVHQGFQTAWSSVTAYALTIIREQLHVYPDYNIVTVGHSLGGAMASLAAVTLKEIYLEKPLKMYTYGQPRTGNVHYARMVENLIGVDKIYRCVHGLDGVPTMVPAALGYHHHGTEYWALDPSGPNRTFICDGGAAEGKEDPEGSCRVPSTGINLAHCEYFGIPWLVPFFKLGV